MIARARTALFFAPFLFLFGCSANDDLPLYAATGTGAGGGTSSTQTASGGSSGHAGASGASGAAGTGTSAFADSLPATCNPLRQTDACLTPWPSAVYMDADASTKTGFRLALKTETLPATTKGTKLDASRWNVADGFSPATPILAYFPERIDPKSLPFIRDPSTSLSPDSATVIVDMTTNQLVAHFSEVDVAAKDDGLRQALIMHPTTRLETGHRYAVAITTAIKTVDGKTPSSPPQWDAIVHGNPPADDLAKKQAARMPDILKSLSAAGVDSSKLVMAWDFVTASDDFLTGHVVSMRDQALAVTGNDGVGYHLDKVTEAPNQYLLRKLDGTYQVPLFLSSGDPTTAQAELTFDASGKPQYSGHTYDVPFSLILPKVAATQKVPLLLFGHGLFGSGPEYLDNETIQKIANDYGVAMVATDWSGLSKWEFPLTTGGNGAAGDAVQDFNHLNWITDRLQQSLVNAIVLVRTAGGVLAKDPAMSASGKDASQPVLDGGDPIYFGISLGGIMGGSFMAYGCDVKRGVINVAGSTWSLMFQRSSNWPQFDLLISGSYPDPFDQQILLALAQPQFDFSDPINAAPHWFNPLPGCAKKQILQQMSVGDAQVPNIASEILARTGGLTLLNDSPISIFEMPPTPGPLASGLTVWDLHADPFPPDTNLGPKTDNGVHAGLITTVTQAQDQVNQFLKTGQIVDLCSGVCDPN